MGLSRSLHSPDDFQVQTGLSCPKIIRYTFDKMFMKARSAVIWSGVSLLGLGRGLGSLVAFLNLVWTFLATNPSLANFSWKFDLYLLCEVAARGIARDGRGLCFPDNFQNFMVTSLSQATSLVKFSGRYDQQLLSGQVCHCWVFAEICALHTTCKISQNFLV